MLGYAVQQQGSSRDLWPAGLRQLAPPPASLQHVVHGQGHLYATSATPHDRYLLSAHSQVCLVLQATRWTHARRATALKSELGCGQHWSRALLSASA